MSTALDRVLERLDGVRRSGDGYSAKCPTHDDTSNSLSVGSGDDGRVLLKCFVGCLVEDVVDSIGLTVSDLFVDGTPASRKQRALSIDDLAQHKKLPVAFLVSLGLDDRPDGVRIEYRDRNGNPTPRQRLRTSFVSKNGFLWIHGKGQIVPYGLDRLRDARERRHLLIVEGESDCWSLWFHGFAALGLPGAEMYHKLNAEHLIDLDTVYVFHEPDDGGGIFVNGVGGWIRELGWTGELRELQIPGVKDPSELHCKNPEGFKSVIERALDEAVVLPVDIPKPKSRIDTQSAASLVTSSGVGSLSSGSTGGDIDNALRGFASGLVKLDSLSREIARRAAKDHLQAVGIRGGGALVDSATKTVEHRPSNESLLLVDPEPFDDAVDGQELASEIEGIIRRHVALDQHCVTATVLWVFFTYCFKAAEVAPILAITSPIMRCGKSTLLDIVAFLVPRRLSSSNITPAAMFRVVDKYSPILLVDEADTFLNKNDELRGIINASHYKSTAYVLRSSGDDHEPRQFSTWCPKAIALIGKLRDTMEDRSITIQMRRRKPSEEIAKFRREVLNRTLGVVRRQLARWGADHIAQLQSAEPEMPDILEDRAADNWWLLLAIADEVGGMWPEKAREAAIMLSTAASEEDGTIRVQLLADIRQVFDEKRTDFLKSTCLLEHLHEMEERPWGEWGRTCKPMSARQLRSQLKPFGVESRQKKIQGRNERGYEYSSFEDSFSRYLLPQVLPRDSFNEINDLERNSIRDPSGTVADPSATSTDGSAEGSGSDPGRPGWETGPSATSESDDALERVVVESEREGFEI